MSTSLLFIHGRAEHSSDQTARDPDRQAAYVLAKKRAWLAGLAKGLITAGLPAVDEETVAFPFYADAFADAIRDFEARGGRRPQLELLSGGTPGVLSGPGEAEQAALLETKVAGVLDLADALGYDPVKEAAYSDPGLGVSPDDVARELAIGDVLALPVLRGALQFLSRKTGIPAWIIEQFLEDVAYYLELSGMRDLVLGIVREELARQQPAGGDVVVVGHSLGSVVAYDLLTRLPSTYRVRLLVTAGSPLGFPIVQKNLLAASPGVRPAVPPVVPPAVPARRAAWLNAYDVRDVVALLNPLAGSFTEALPGQLVDERTHNPSCPHAIEDYLSDPDVAVPISRAMRD